MERNSGMKTIRYSVPEIMCEGCAKTIKRALGVSAAISLADVDIPGKIVTVVYDESVISPDEIKALIEGAGYDTFSIE